MTSARDFPARHHPLLLELATRLLESRKARAPLDALARDLLRGFHAICFATARDSIVAAIVPQDVSDPSALADDPECHSRLVASLTTLNLDGGGPRGPRPAQVADAVLAALGVTVIDDSDRGLTLDGSLRAAVTEAIVAACDAGLAIPAVRDAVIATARARCDSQHHAAFDRIVAQLDERGMRINVQPKVPIDASQAVQRHLGEARDIILTRIANAAVDSARDIIAREHPEAAARIDQPVTHTLTPRDVAVRRACDPRLPKRPQLVAENLLASLTEVAHIAWSAPERHARAYAATATFAVGDVIDHPKFGRGSVTSVATQRIDVEFPDGKYTLVHRK